MKDLASSLIHFKKLVLAMSGQTDFLGREGEFLLSTPLLSEMSTPDGKTTTGDGKGPTTTKSAENTITPC